MLSKSVVKSGPNVLCCYRDKLELSRKPHYKGQKAEELGVQVYLSFAAKEVEVKVVEVDPGLKGDTSQGFTIAEYFRDTGYNVGGSSSAIQCF
ncbi:hypothetical protein Tco_0025208 [Tanacetum coccineum]